jgi:hypothetical protein
MRTDVNDLRTDVTELRADFAVMRTDVNDLQANVAGMRADFADMRTDVIRHIGEAVSHVANVMMEQTRIQIAALDDKYRDVPESVETVRGELDTHVTDVAVHVKPSAPRVRSRARRTKRS